MGNEKEKELETLNEQELLIKLLRQQQKSAWSRKLLLIFMAIITATAIITSLVLVPKAFRTMADAEELIKSTQTSLAEFDGIVENIESLTTDANTLIAENADAVTEVMEKINNIDFDSLNQSINDLSNILDPLAKFFQRFS